MTSNFILLNNTSKTNDYINKVLVNCPNKEVVLKNKLEFCLYKSIELIFYYKINKGRIRIKYIKELIVNYSMIDYYIGICYKKKIINKKKYEVICKYLLELRKISYGLLKSES